MMNITVLFTTSFLWSAMFAHAQGTIDVNFVKLMSDDGKVIVSLFNQDEGFPADFQQAFRSEEVAVKNGQAKYTFEDVPWGEYAVTVMHDENGNGEIEKNFIGIPKEKVGIANLSGGLPSFKRAAFRLDADRPRSELIIEPFN